MEKKDMKNKVLYFPYINVPNSIWFTRMLLYWDEVGAIVPYEYIDNPEKLDSHTKSLVEAELVRAVPAHLRLRQPCEQEPHDVEDAGIGSRRRSRRLSYRLLINHDNLVYQLNS